MDIRARKTKSFQKLSVRNDFNIQTSKNQWFFNKKMSKSHPARSCGFVGKPTLFKQFCQTGFCEQLFRTSATTVAHLPGPSSLSNNTMRDTFVFCARTPKSPKTIGFLRILAPRIIKSHESHRRSSKNTCTTFQNFYPRALSES